MPYSPRLALRVGERQSWVKCLVQEHNVAASGSDGSSLPTQSHFTATPGDQAFEPPSGFESPTLSITSRARYRLSHHATILIYTPQLFWTVQDCALHRRGSRGSARGARPPPLFFGLAVPNLSPTLHARTPMIPPAPPPFSNPRSAPVYGTAVRLLHLYCGKYEVRQ